MYLRGGEEMQANIKRSEAGAMVSGIAILVNLMLVIGKSAVGLASGSVAVLGDAVNNLSDIATSVIAFIGFRVSEQPADAEHPYGHGRIEYLASLCVAVMVMAVGINVFLDSAKKCIHPTPVTISAWMGVVLLASVLVKGFLFLYFRRMSRKIKASIFGATAADSRNDAMTTLVILVAALVEKTWRVAVDGPVGVAVSIYIMLNGISLIRDGISPILGRAPDRSVVVGIRKLVESAPHVLGMHDLLVHDYGPGRQFASAHVEMPADMTPIDMHEIIDAVERQVQEDLGIQMVIHCDPVVKDRRADEMRHFLETSGICKGMTVHDLRIVPTSTKAKVMFDCVIPYTKRNPEEDVRERVVTCFNQKYPEYLCIPTIEHSFTGDGIAGETDET